MKVNKPASGGKKQWLGVSVNDIVVVFILVS